MLIGALLCVCVCCLYACCLCVYISRFCDRCNLLTRALTDWQACTPACVVGYCTVLYCWVPVLQPHTNLALQGLKEPWKGPSQGVVPAETTALRPLK
ncbi:hypothetical protein M758_10G004900 [Ceratodon purpureus]|uniref:Uncharacterized protein n=1 Tax=Ceratodon purpureus TaxID=3225 RepID=A0A8T0GHP1_CERPU|nr:hypothetical protein KC19_10G005800 [Ceratodon purpureus]KAG0602298.1 hypothetical protein M758_10G004900 [Ceratodon purpureus]